MVQNDRAIQERAFGPLRASRATTAQLHDRANFGKPGVMRRIDQRAGQAVVVDVGVLASGIADAVVAAARRGAADPARPDPARFGAERSARDSGQLRRAALDRFAFARNRGQWLSSPIASPRRPIFRRLRR